MDSIISLALTTLTKKPVRFSAIATGRQYIPVCSIGAPPTKDLPSAVAPAHYRFSLLSYPNVRKTPMIQPVQIERRNDRVGLQFATPSVKALAGRGKADLGMSR